VFGLLIESDSESLESQDANGKPLGNNNNGKPLGNNNNGKPLGNNNNGKPLAKGAACTG